MFGMSTTSPMLPQFAAPEPHSRDNYDSLIRVCLLGSRESGKTCFLGGIGLLDRLPGWNVRADGRSLVRLDQIVTALSNVCSWLPGTQDTERYVLTIASAGGTASIDLIDYPGQNFHRVIRPVNREVDANLLDHFLEADYLLLMVDPTDDPANTTSRNALIDAVKHRFLGNGAGKRPGVAVILTKADELGQAGSDSAKATAFINERFPEFLPKLASIAGKVAVFPISAVGAVDSNGRPTANAKPTGYGPLFKWMMPKQLARPRPSTSTWPRWPAVAGAAVAVAALAWLVPDYLAYRSNLETLNDTSIAAMDRLDRTRDYNGWHQSSFVAAREKLASGEVDRLNAAVRETTETAPLRRIAEEARAAKARVPAAMQANLAACQAFATNKAASLTYESLVKMKEAGNPLWIERAQLYLDRYPDDSKAGVVCDWFATGRTDQHKSSRRQIAEIEVDDPASCFFKAEAMRRFLLEFGKHEAPRERQRIARAAELAEMFSRKRDWVIHFTSAGELKDARGITLRVYNPEGDFVGVDFDGSRRVTNSDEARSMDWRPGQPLRVQIWANEAMLPYNRSETLAATLTIDSPFALVNLLDPNEGCLELRPEQSWRDRFAGTPYARFRVGSLQPEDVRIVKEYLYPGTRWQ